MLLARNKEKISYSSSFKKLSLDVYEYNIEVLEPYAKRLFETYTDETYKDINYFRSDRTRHLIVLKCIEYFCGKKN